MTLISTIFSCLTALVLYHLGKMLYREEIGLYAVLFFVTSEYFLFFSQTGLSDATFTFFSTAALFFFLRALRTNKTSDFWKAALFTTLCLYTKYSAAPIIITFLILGILKRHTINRRWVVVTILLPLAAFTPYLLLFLYSVSPVEIGGRHMPLLGLNHLKYLYYILIFAPIPFVYTLARTVLQRRHVKYTGYLHIYLLVYFMILGFYYPYFRLSYPLVPLLSIFAGSFIASLGRIKHYVLAFSLALAVLLSLDTINYSTQIPEDVADIVRHHVTTKDIKYVYSVTPPNIYFYMDGEIAVPSTHPWHRFGRRYPCFIKSRLILEQNKNLLATERHVLCVHATIFDFLKSRYRDIYDNAMLVSRIEYEDAPVYNKDIFSPLYGIPQSYEVYLLDETDIARHTGQIWSFGFEREVKVLHAVPRYHD